ncbi:hypothetical protein Tco_0465575 [Tanacetum coccineum]
MGGTRTVLIAWRHVSMVAIGRVIGFISEEWIDLEVGIQVVAGRQVLELADSVVIYLVSTLFLLPHPVVKLPLIFVLLVQCLANLPITLAYVALHVLGKPIWNVANYPLSIDVIEVVEINLGDPISSFLSTCYGRCDAMVGKLNL